MPVPAFACDMGVIVSKHIWLLIGQAPLTVFSRVPLFLLHTVMQHTSDPQRPAFLLFCAWKEKKMDVDLMMSAQTAC